MGFKKSISLVGLFLGLMLSTHSLTHAAEDAVWSAPVPTLMDDENYSETWQQLFLFDDGTLLSTEFLLANFPFSSHHGIMLSTLVLPDGTQYIIKNGRTRDGWEFKDDPFMLRIYQHILSRGDDRISLRLDNSMAQVDLSIIPQAQGFDLPRLSGGKGKWQDVSLYSPLASASGAWMPGPETGISEEMAQEVALKNGVGFGIHTVQNANMHDLMTGWLKLFGYGNTDGEVPVLNVIFKPDDSQQVTMAMLGAGGSIQNFNVDKLRVVESQEINEAIVPRRIQIEASFVDQSIKGTIELADLKQAFFIDDHLNTIELVAARGEPKIKRFRFRAEYQFALIANGVETSLTGSALTEYMDVEPPEGSRRRRSRR